MYYDMATGQGLPRSPLKALVAPRPIAWISTLAHDGKVNLAPYSFFNIVAEQPPLVMFSSETLKDTRRNIEATGEFVINLATFELRHELNLTSQALPAAQEEHVAAGLEMVACRAVRPPRVARSPVAIECRYVMTVPLRGADRSPSEAALVVGQVVGMHIDDSLVCAGTVDLLRARPIGRMGYQRYSVLAETFDMPRP